jgi:hypothetical protein
MPGEAFGDINCRTSAPALSTHTVKYGEAASVTVQTWATKDFYHATRSTVCGGADYTGLKGAIWVYLIIQTCELVKTT